jgi:hypothetical protein
VTYDTRRIVLIWVALVPLLLVGLAVALVPVTLGIIHDHRAQNTAEHSHLFFVPPRGAQPVAPHSFKSEVEERLERVEAMLAQALSGRTDDVANVAMTGSKPGPSAS